MVNYNKFELRNPYRVRLEDFVNEGVIQQIISGFGHACSQPRNKYAAAHEDIPEGWSLGSTLAYFGLDKLSSIWTATPSTVISQDIGEQLAAL